MSSGSTGDGASGQIAGAVGGDQDDSRVKAGVLDGPQEVRPGEVRGLRLKEDEVRLQPLHLTENFALLVRAIRNEIEFASSLEGSPQALPGNRSIDGDQNTKGRCRSGNAFSLCAQALSRDTFSCDLQGADGIRISLKGDHPSLSRRHPDFSQAHKDLVKESCRLAPIWQ